MDENNKKDEVKFFEKRALNWWDKEKGPYPCLHTFNDFRIPLLINYLNESKGESLINGVKILDAGCGVGLLSEPLAKLGAEVTGIDPGEEVIKMAQIHASFDSDIKRKNLRYIQTTVEEHSVKNKEFYDCIVSSEVIEHVDNKESYLKNCVKCLKPGGTMLITTFHKTCIARFFGIFIYEYVFGIISRGTHNFPLFISIEEVTRILEKYGCQVDVSEQKSFFLNPFNLKWSYTPFSLFPNVYYSVKAVKK